MSKQRKRHMQRQPIEETVRTAVAEFVGGAGDVDVERHSYDWRADDLLVWVRLRQPIAGPALELFCREMSQKMAILLPKGQPLDEWLVAVECEGKSLASAAFGKS